VTISKKVSFGTKSEGAEIKVSTVPNPRPKPCPESAAKGFRDRVCNSPESLSQRLIPISGPRLTSAIREFTWLVCRISLESESGGYGSMPMRSFTAPLIRCLQPRYRSVV
jgi:hypothetical protein